MSGRSPGPPRSSLLQSSRVFPPSEVLEAEGASKVRLDRGGTPLPGTPYLSQRCRVGPFGSG